MMAGSSSTGRCFSSPSALWLVLYVSSCAVIGQILAELRFSVHQLSEDDTSVKFDLQIVRYSPEPSSLCCSRTETCWYESVWRSLPEDIVICDVSVEKNHSESSWFYVFLSITGKYTANRSSSSDVTVTSDQKEFTCWSELLVGKSCEDVEWRVIGEQKKNYSDLKWQTLAFLNNWHRRFQAKFLWIMWMIKVTV